MFFPCLPEPLFFLVYGITVFPYVFTADIKNIPFRELIVIPALSQEFPIRNRTVKPGPPGMVSDIRPFYLQMADNALLIFCKDVQPCPMRDYLRDHILGSDRNKLDPRIIHQDPYYMLACIPVREHYGHEHIAQ